MIPSSSMLDALASCSRPGKGRHSILRNLLTKSCHRSPKGQENCLLVALHSRLKVTSFLPGPALARLWVEKWDEDFCGHYLLYRYTRAQRVLLEVWRRLRQSENSLWKGRRQA